MRDIGKILPKKSSIVHKSFYSLRFQLYAIIFLLSILLVGSILSSLASIWDHTGEEAQLEIANHQILILLQSASLVDRNTETVFDPTYTIETFEKNLLALMTGGIGIDRDGAALEVSPPQDDPVRNQLTKISAAWDSYRDLLVNIMTLPEGDSSSEMLLDVAQNQYSILIDLIDELVILLEEHMANDHRKLVLIQFTFFLFAFPLIIFGSFIIRRRIVDPLQVLRNAANRFGQGDLSTSIQIVGNDEMTELADTFEVMRSDILNSNIRLEDQVAVRTHELSVAFEFSQEIVGQLDFESLLAMIPQKSSALMHAEHAFLCLVNPKDNTVEMYADISGVRKGNKPRQQAELVQDVVIDGKALVAMVPDYACRFIQAQSAKQCISVPLRSGDRIIGAICALRDRSDVIDKNELQAFTLLANSAAVAIENIRLINFQEQQARQNATSLERQRLASEFHDNLIQMLNLINLRIGQIQSSFGEYPGRDFRSEFDLVKSNVIVAIEQVRMMMGDLVSPYQGEASMVSRVKKDIQVFEEKAKLKVNVTGTGAFLDRLAPLSQKQLLMK